MYSYWENKYWFDEYETVIVGGGITGLSTAYYLRKHDPGKKVLVLEKSVIPRGASTKNAGFACFGTAGEVLDDLNTLSEEDLVNLISLRWQGLQRLQEIHGADHIQYRNKGGYEVFDNKEEYERCADSLGYVNRLMEEATGVRRVLNAISQEVLPGFYNQCISNPHEGELNPVLLIRNLQKLCGAGCRIVNGVGLESFETSGGGYRLMLDNGMELSTRNLVLCTNAFTGALREVDVIPVRNQVIMSEKLPGLKLHGDYHYDRGYYYFRMVDERLLIGGARNIDPERETTDRFEPNSRILDTLRRFAEERILGKQVNFEYSWSGIIASGSEKVPILEVRDNGLILAVRLGGMGIAIGSELGFQAAELVRNRRTH